MRVFHAAIFNYIYRVDSFATYAYSCLICPLEFLIVFKLKNNKKIPAGKWDSYTRMLQMNPLIAIYVF